MKVSLRRTLIWEDLMRNLEKKRRQKRHKIKLTTKQREKSQDLRRRRQLNVSGDRSVKSAMRKRDCVRSRTRKEKLKSTQRNNKLTWTTSNKKPAGNSWTRRVEWSPSATTIRIEAPWRDKKTSVTASYTMISEFPFDLIKIKITNARRICLPCSYWGMTARFCPSSGSYTSRLQSTCVFVWVTHRSSRIRMGSGCRQWPKHHSELTSTKVSIGCND